ncbi:MAG: amino acid ABC transporter permease [Actinobacteria bacterium]|nr:amino acid ABC transporter permease [Actinomycetota bacterium]
MDRLVPIIVNNYDSYLSGLWMTVRLVGISFVIAMLVGTLVASLRIAPARPLNWIGMLYVESFRNVPLLVLAIIFSAGLLRAGFDIGRLSSASIALGLYTAAYIAESIRSGVSAVSKGQIEASLSLGFTYRQTMRQVILPQAFRTVIPPIGNLIIAMIKNSAIVAGSLIALTDILKVARVVNSRTFATNEAFFWAGVGYLLLTIPATIIVRRLEKRFAIKR